ncbi:hypothetical protein M3O96_17030 [Aquiflexum sp. TKW24L]|nr:hypothetical protein [Aquiflexum sp. TKW24L]MCL6260809.1 hypothetical protein [Aquiflexum sp. TKW24L]
MEINETTNSEDTSEELSWLKNLQRNSWEPDVIIPGQVYDFAVRLTQD